jgi:hypothetical protein
MQRDEDNGYPVDSLAPPQSFCFSMMCPCVIHIHIYIAMVVADVSHFLYVKIDTITVLYERE